MEQATACMMGSYSCPWGDRYTDTNMLMSTKLISGNQVCLPATGHRVPSLEINYVCLLSEP